MIAPKSASVRWFYAPMISALLLIGFCLRLGLLDAYPFREDEALYSFWALHSLRGDPLFLTVWPDKPPLFIWALSTAFSLFGQSAAAARYANILFSTLTIVVLVTTARVAWGERAALVTAAIVSFSPFAISFAPTAFTDPLLLLTGSLAFLCAVHGGMFWAGVWLAAAVLTKQQGLLFAPLIFGILMLKRKPFDTAGFGLGGVRRAGDAAMAGARHAGPNDPSNPGFRLIRRRLQPFVYGRTAVSQSLRLAGLFGRFPVGLALIIAPAILWDSLRWSVAPSPWDLGRRNYAVLTLLPIDQWPARWSEWSSLLRFLPASPWVWTLFLVVMAVALASNHPAIRRRGTVRDLALPGLLLVWGVLFILLHLISSVQIWDRYLLPLILPLALLSGWAAASSSRIWSTRGASILVILLLLGMAQPAWSAAQGRLPIGGDHGAYAGFYEALGALPEFSAGEVATSGASAHALRTQSILYHNVLGWHLQFYLFDAVGNGTIDLRWFPSSTYLADNAEKSPLVRKFFFAADWAEQPDLERTLRMRNMVLSIRKRAGAFTLYEIVDRDVDNCGWCRCRPATDWAVVDIMPAANLTLFQE